MKIGNGWHDNREWPKETGGYIIIAKFHISDSEKNTDLIVKDGDTVIDTDFFNSAAGKNSPTSIGGEMNFRFGSGIFANLFENQRTNVCISARLMI